MSIDDDHTPPHTAANALPTEAIIQAKDNLADLRALTMEERGKLIKMACQAAARLERSKILSGLPPSQPAPWPKSTWQFLKEHARNAQRSATD
ncbi:MAG: hypothetical protein CMJ64_12135 [Planctomycetaceae bacterium]|nr:hypothetical protein [Planctomycetaceae bacterium]